MQKEPRPSRPLERPGTPFGAPQDLDIQVSYRLGAPLLYVSGELDCATAPGLRKAVEQELAGEHRFLFLEASSLGYIDSSGLNILFDVARSLRDQGWVGLVGAQTHVIRLAQLTGLAEQPGFRLVADMTEAAAMLSAEGRSQPGLAADVDGSVATEVRD